jgi:hypothetical protein
MRRLILATIACGAAIAPAAAQTPKLDDLPAAIKPPGLAVYLEVPATGAQVYTCGKNDAGAPTWVFKAPDAQLFDTQKKQIGKHYAGPTWEALAGGKVVAGAKGNTPAPEAGSIPWLWLEVKSSEGSSTFNQAKAILRVSTHGGVAPTQGCDAAHAGQEARVPYTATYLFLK